MFGFILVHLFGFFFRFQLLTLNLLEVGLYNFFYFLSMNLSWYDEPDRWFNTIKKFANTNGKSDEIFMLVDCNEFYRHDIPSLYSLVNTDKNISSVYTEGITVGKKRNSKKPKSTMTCHLYRWHYQRYKSVGQIRP